MVKNGLRLPASGFRLLWLAVLLGACTPSFQSVEQVTDLRVLAIQAEPPDALVDVDAGTVDPVTVRVLVADPNAGVRKANVTGLLCFPSLDASGGNNLVCDPDPAKSVQLVPKTENVGVVTLDPISIPPVYVAAAAQADTLKGLGGIRVQLTLAVDTGDPAGPAHAEKVLLYDLKRAGFVPNHNPVVTGLALYVGGTLLQTLAPGEKLDLIAGHAVGLRPVLPCADDQPGGCAGGEEVYSTTDLQGRTVTLREQISWSFFITNGAEVDVATADEPLPALAAPTDGIVRITGDVTGSGTLWIVGRDGRGGAAWLTVPWESR